MAQQGGDAPMAKQKDSGPEQISPFAPLAGRTALARAVLLERDGERWRNAACMLNIAGGPLGGQLAAHCIAAAMLGDEPFEPSALHVLFVGGGDPGRYYQVGTEALRNGRRVAHRSVRIVQDQSILVSAAVTLRSADIAAGIDPLVSNGVMPNVPPPEALAPRSLSSDDSDSLNRGMMASYPFLEIRGPEGYVPGMAVLDGLRDFYWMRIPDSRDLPPADHFALLTLASDFWYTLPIHGLARGRRRPSFATTSLDHAVWFHRRPDCSEWLLVETQGLFVAQGLGMKRATIWSRSGEPIASIVQQALIRR